MNDFDELDVLSLKPEQRACIEDLLYEKNRLIDVAHKDVDALKREINVLKKQLDYSKMKKK